MTQLRQECQYAFPETVRAAWTKDLYVPDRADRSKITSQRELVPWWDWFIAQFKKEEQRFGLLARRNLREWPQCRYGGVIEAKLGYEHILSGGKGKSGILTGFFVCSLCHPKWKERVFGLDNLEGGNAA